MMNNSGCKTRSLSGRCFVILSLFLLFGCQNADEVVLHVAPDGNDNWSGLQVKVNKAGDDGPLATLAGARDAVRRLKAQGPLTKPVRVVIAAGKYQMAEPVEFTQADSGTESCPVIYEAAKNAKPLFFGGRIISGFKKGPDGIWQAQIPEVTDRKSTRLNSSHIPLSRMPSSA